MERREFLKLSGAAGVGALVGTPLLVSPSSDVSKVETIKAPLAYLGDDYPRHPLDDHPQSIVYGTCWISVEVAAHHLNHGLTNIAAQCKEKLHPHTCEMFDREPSPVEWESAARTAIRSRGEDPSQRNKALGISVVNLIHYQKACPHLSYMVAMNMIVWSDGKMRVRSTQKHVSTLPSKSHLDPERWGYRGFDD